MHGKFIPITSVEYFREQDKDSRRENLRYFAGDNETGERGQLSYGKWFVPDNVTGEAVTDRIVNGQPVEWDLLDKVSRAIDPDTGDSYYTRTGKSAYVAQDLTNSAPKSVSVLLGLGEAEAINGSSEFAAFGRAIADACKESHIEANDVSMNYYHDIEAIATRTGGAGKNREGAAWWTAAQYTHFTSRKGDMQLHTHNVILNVGRRSDGTIGAIDNYKANAYRGAASALYRAELFSRLKKRLAPLGINIHVSKDGRNATIDGVPEALTTHFSKRRQDILEEMAKNGHNGTANNREAAQMAAWRTRDKKEDLPSHEELTGIWRLEAKALGYNLASLIENVNMTSQAVESERAKELEKLRSEAKANGSEIPDEVQEFDLEKIKADALKSVLEFDSTFESRTMLTNLLEQLQIHVDAKTALKMVEEIQGESKLVAIGVKGRSKETVYTTDEVLRLEAEMLLMAETMQNNVAPINLAEADRRIALGIPKNDGTGEAWAFRPEQANFIKHLLGGSSLTVTNGYAGAGKSTSMRIAAEVANAEGYTVIVSGPTHRSVDVLRKETGTDPKNAYAVAGLLSAYKSGKFVPSPNSFIMIDEAGMIPLRDWCDLVKMAHETGARIAFVGDVKQKQPVAAGAPMKATMDIIGAARLVEIARQKEEWARTATRNFADGEDITEGVMAYYDRGFIKFADDAEGVEKAALAHFMKLTIEEPDASVVWIAKTNADVARFNQAIRDWKVDQGILSGEAHRTTVLSRGKEPRRVDDDFMQGERIITGETVTFQGEKVSNNSFGRILAITPAEDPKAEPRWTVKWDDGRVMTFKPSEFIGFRDQDDPLKAFAKISRADCMTDYAAQGLTAKHAIKTNLSPDDRESWYVGASRHTHTLNVFVDSARIHNDLATSSGKTFTVSKKDGSTKQEDDEPTIQITEKQLLETFIEECGISNGKKNACDFLGGAKNFLDQYRDKFAGNRERKPMENSVAAPSKSDHEEMTNFVRGIGRTGGQAAEQVKAKSESEKIAEYMKTPSKPDFSQYGNVKAKREPTPKPHESQRLDKTEIDKLVRENLADYIRADGHKQEYHNNSHTEFTFSVGKQNKAIVKQTDRGNWVFFLTDESAKGDIRNYVAWRDGLSFGQASHALRAEFGTKDNNTPSPYSLKDREPAAPRIEQTNAERWTIANAKAYAKEKFERIQNWWNGMENTGSGYLLHKRGITLETQAVYRNGFRVEGAKPFDHWNKSGETNKGGVAFQMVDSNMNLTGFVRRGPTTMTNDKGEVVPFNKNAAGTERHLVAMGELQNPKAFHIGEAPIDGMSRSQKMGNPEGVALLATGGSVGEEARAMVYALAQRHPTAEWVWVGQNDKADRRNEQRIKEAVFEGNPTAKFEASRPQIEYKDWNDEIRDRRRPDAEIEAELKEQATAAPAPTDGRSLSDQAEARFAEIAAAEERRRREAEERKNTPRGPRL